MQRSGRFYVYAAMALVAAVTVLRLWFLFTTPITLFADEAQYWVWSKHLDFGYYSKPPLIAWIIALTTAACGDAPGCVRLGAPLINAATALVLYACGARLFGARGGFWACATFLLLPGVTLGSFLIATDAPLMFFWALALYCLLRARGGNQRRWWLGMGVACGFGLLSKYTMAAFLLAPLALAWRNPRLWAALGVALLVCSPNIIWNARNGFVSYAHLLDNARGGAFTRAAPEAEPPLVFAHCAPAPAAETEAAKPAPALLQKLEFFFAQFGVFGPVPFAALLLLLWRREWKRDEGERLLVWLTLPLLAAITLLSLVTRANANWAAPSYVAATLLVAGFLLPRPRWLIATLALHLLALLAFTQFDALQQKFPPLAKADPFLRMRGWDALAERIREQQSLHSHAPLLAEERKLTAMLSYTLRSPDGAPAMVYKWNEDGRMSDYFDMTADVAAQEGKDFLLVAKAYDMLPCRIARRFSGGQALEVAEIPIARRKNLTYAIDYVRHFRGYRR